MNASTSYSASHPRKALRLRNAEQRDDYTRSARLIQLHERGQRVVQARLQRR
jgi:hypothetical protein